MSWVGFRSLSASALLVLALGSRAPALAQSLQPLQIVTASGVHDFKVEIAADDASRERGLMNRRYMPADHGMLFEFPSDAPPNRRQPRANLANKKDTVQICDVPERRHANSAHAIELLRERVPSCF